MPPLLASPGRATPLFDVGVSDADADEEAGELAESVSVPVAGGVVAGALLVVGAALVVVAAALLVVGAALVVVGAALVVVAAALVLGAPDTVICPGLVAGAVTEVESDGATLLLFLLLSTSAMATPASTTSRATPIAMPAFLPEPEPPPGGT